jgi:sugar phosphate isomerase/epimerase
MKRRTFLSLGIAGGASVLLGGFRKFPVASAAPAEEEFFKISLAEWSLNKSLFAGKINHLDFPKIAKRDYGIDCVEYVDQFFADKPSDTPYLKELKERADGEGVRSGLIMLDTNGPLGVADKATRDTSVEKTFRWIDAAAFLGCRTVRVNARGEKDPNELRNYMVESCTRLADYAKDRNINVVIENHGQQSSDPEWLVSVMTAVNKPNFGTLPDFGNFPAETNRYDAVERLMPFAKSVSAKATTFTEDGLVGETDFFRMMRVVRDAGYAGYVGVESSTGQEDEAEPIRKTRDLLLKIREQQQRCHSIFNGHDAKGWTPIEGGEWNVADGVLMGRNGQNWSTDPEKTGSWLRTDKEYGDFRLELQYAINEGGNSGVFFRAAQEKNPAFTGYEMQIVDFFGQEPSKQGATSIYDVVAPEKNLVRPAGEWNTVTITAQSSKITFEMNGEKVLETEQTRSTKGFIGLQNHDDKSEVKFRNIRVEEL